MNESALGVALKAVRKPRREQTIRVCDDCGVPLIWTFAFDYRERYCLNCGAGGGMLGTGNDVPATIELRFQKKVVDAIWDVIYGNKGLVPTSSQRTKCKKCNEKKEAHYNHLTVAQKEWDTIARKYLDQFQGLFTTK